MNKTLIEISFDDGTPTDIVVLKLLHRYSLTDVATFFIPTLSWGYNNLDKYIDEKVSIGGHTVSHPMDMKQLSDEDLHAEVVNNMYDLEDSIRSLIEIPNPAPYVTQFCPPRGRYDERVIDAIKKAGFHSMRTTKVLETSDSDDFIKHTTIHFFNRKEYNGVDWYEKALEILGKNPKVFRCWGHSEEILRCDGSFDKLDKFCKALNEYRNR